MFVRSIMTSLLLIPLLAGATAPKEQKAEPPKSYSQDEVTKAAEDFFGSGAKGLATVIEKAFKEKGEPMAIIQGEEAGGAVAVGVRYGHGKLIYKGQGSGTKVYWQGPSIGFDFGGNAAKVFVLVYGLPSSDALFQRYPGVEGSLFFVGGFGLNYVQNDKTILAPVRFGVGWRQGVGVGYMHFTRAKRYNPF
ncbi:MAG TPA: DUF1134 domain-containing protein [Steroidobacteraceae bacterium]|nr:DUF1134 domain-containing protein [Steroidobacteraceae bacterium]